MIKKTRIMIIIAVLACVFSTTILAEPMWIFEQLRKEKPDIVAHYFQTKRKLATRDKIKKYTADDGVAVLSIAMGRDLFAWFQSLGITVDRSQVKIEME